MGAVDTSISKFNTMKLLLLVGLVAGCQAGYIPYFGLHHVIPTVAVATGDSVPVAVGGYKAVAGEGGAVHEVPGLFHAPAVVKQESEGGVSLSTGTSAIVHLGKREAEADAGLLFSDTLEFPSELSLLEVPFPLLSVDTELSPVRVDLSTRFPVSFLPQLCSRRNPPAE